MKKQEEQWKSSLTLKHHAFLKLLFAIFIANEKK